jgi:hypothetical protein
MAKLKPAPKAILILAVTAAIGFGVFKSGVLRSEKAVQAPAEVVVQPTAQPVQAAQPVQTEAVPSAVPEATVQSSNAGIDAVLKAAGKK